MIIIIVLFIAGLAGFCMLASDDLTSKRDLSIHSWVIVLLILGGIIGCLFICEDYIRTDSIKNYTEGKYKLEEVIYSDTTYVVRKTRQK